MLFSSDVKLFLLSILFSSPFKFEQLGFLTETDFSLTQMFNGITEMKTKTHDFYLKTYNSWSFSQGTHISNMGQNHNVIID